MTAKRPKALVVYIKLHIIIGTINWKGLRRHGTVYNIWQNFPMRKKIDQLCDTEFHDALTRSSVTSFKQSNSYQIWVLRLLRLKTL